MSDHIAISSMAIIHSGPKANCFESRRRCITLATSLLISCGGSFYATVVFFLNDKSFRFKNFSNHPLLDLNSLSPTFLSYINFALQIISFRETLSIWLRHSSIHTSFSSSCMSMAFAPPPSSYFRLTPPVEVLFTVNSSLLLRHSLTLFPGKTNFLLQ